jgi:hypothetical protein
MDDVVDHGSGRSPFSNVKMKLLCKRCPEELQTASRREPFKRRAARIRGDLCRRAGGLYHPFDLTNRLRALQTTPKPQQATQQRRAVERGDDRAPANKLVERFASRSIIKGRLMTMVASHYLVHQDGRFSLTSKGRRIASSLPEHISVTVQAGKFY